VNGAREQADYFITLCLPAQGQNCGVKNDVPPVRRAVLWKEADVNG
jgi:hypothetical protein